MGGGAMFGSLLKMGLFTVCVWFSGQFGKHIGVSTIILEILVGIALGPSGADLLPREYSLCQAKTYMEYGSNGDADFTAEIQSEWNTKCSSADYLSDNDFDSTNQCLAQKGLKKQLEHCTDYPDMFSMFGHLGVALMIFESGMHFDFNMARVVGPKALVVGSLGTALPLTVGYALNKLFASWPDDLKEPDMSALATGVALAPTSVGISLKLLLEAKMLHQDFGQLILTSAFLDDIFSLMLFQILLDMEANSGTLTFNAFVPGLIGMGILTGGLFTASIWFPKYLTRLLDYVDEKWPHLVNRKNQPRSKVLLVVIFTLLIFFTWFIDVFKGSHLWGCFIAGMHFSNVDGALRNWSKQTKRVTSWLMRFFFAATVGFSVPVDSMFSLDAFWKGVIMGVLGSIITKLLAGIWLSKINKVVGWAMCGRAEFAYLIAQQAMAKKMMSNDMYAIVIWALFLATIVSPLGFEYYLHKLAQSPDFNSGHGEELTDSDELKDDREGAISNFEREHAPEFADENLPLPLLRYIGARNAQESSLWKQAIDVSFCRLRGRHHVFKFRIVFNNDRPRANDIMMNEFFDEHNIVLLEQTHNGVFYNHYGKDQMDMKKMKSDGNSTPRGVQKTPSEPTAPKRTSMSSLPGPLSKLMDDTSAVSQKAKSSHIYTVQVKDKVFNGKQFRMYRDQLLANSLLTNWMRELQFLPAMGLQYVSFKVFAAQDGGLLETVFESLGRHKMYPLQWNFNTASTVISEDDKDTSPTVQRTSFSEGESEMDALVELVCCPWRDEDQDEWLLDEKLACTNIVTEGGRLFEEIRGVKREISGGREDRVAVRSELLGFELNPLQPRHHIPLEKTLLGAQIQAAQMKKLYYFLEIRFDQEQDLTTVGAGLTRESMMKYLAALPLLFRGLREGGWHILHVKQDHCMLANIPLAVILLSREIDASDPFAAASASDDIEPPKKSGATPVSRVESEPQKPSEVAISMSGSDDPSSKWERSPSKVDFGKNDPHLETIAEAVQKILDPAKMSYSCVRMHLDKSVKENRTFYYPEKNHNNISSELRDTVHLSRTIADFFQPFRRARGGLQDLMAKEQTIIYSNSKEKALAKEGFFSAAESELEMSERDGKGSQRQPVFPTNDKQTAANKNLAEMSTADEEINVLNKV